MTQQLKDVDQNILDITLMAKVLGSLLTKFGAFSTVHKTM